MSRALNAAGLYECVSWAFLDPDRLKRMGWSDRDGLIALQNPLSVVAPILPLLLLPGLLEILAINANRQMPDVRCFEVGNVFALHLPGDGDGLPTEDLRLGLALTGLRAPRARFTGHATASYVYDAKGMAEAALAAAGVGDAEVLLWPDDEAPAYLEPGRAARLVRGGRPCGSARWCLERARPSICLNPVFAAELSVTALATLPAAGAKYEPLPRFPAVQRDLAVVVSAEVTAEVEAAIHAMRAAPAPPRLTLFDVYTGGQFGAGRRSLAWSLTYQAPDRTLTDAEVNQVHRADRGRGRAAVPGRGPRRVTTEDPDGGRAHGAARAAREVGAGARRDHHAACARSATRCRPRWWGSRPSSGSRKATGPSWRACVRSAEGGAGAGGRHPERAGLPAPDIQ